MSISFDKVVLQGMSGAYRQSPAAGRKVQNVKKPSAKSFDEIRISTQGETGVEEKDFVKMMSARLSIATRQTAGTDRLEDLRDRIGSGKYEIDAQDIAGRILLEGKGDR